MPKRKRSARKAHSRDLVVCWNSNGETNAVASRDLLYRAPLRVGSTVTMPWEGVQWEGTVLSFLPRNFHRSQDFGCNSTERRESSDSSDTDSSLTLATIRQKLSDKDFTLPSIERNQSSDSSDPESSLALASLRQKIRLSNPSADDSNLGQEYATDDHIRECDSFLCKEEIWAACHRCRCLLCFTHFEQSEECLSHNMAFLFQ
ncbi:uncharacterized protein [Diadema antillarum]|uniref:uncharacterized protein n=1 Tax=Diadema antillarum TaxID=105358 RepID=UPI003A8C0C36